MPGSEHSGRTHQTMLPIFSHPDYTVGTGIPPVQSPVWGSRGLSPPVGNSPQVLRSHPAPKIDALIYRIGDRKTRCLEMRKKRQKTKDKDKR